MSKPVFWILQPITIQTGMLSYRDQLVLKIKDFASMSMNLMINLSKQQNQPSDQSVQTIFVRKKHLHIYGTAGTHRRLNSGTEAPPCPWFT